MIGDGEGYGRSVRVYALDAGGTLHPGWPVSLGAYQANGIPVIGQGVPESPVLADVNHDGSLEVAIAGFTTGFHLLRGNGTELPGGAPTAAYFSAAFGPDKDPDVTATGSVSTTAGLAFGDLDRDGSPDLVGGSTDIRLAAAASHDGQRIAFQHLASAWHTAAGGAYFRAFPRLVDDWMFLTAPALADVSGDGRPDVVVGTGDGDVHAFRSGGRESPGFPKFVGQWVQASPAAGDIDGDGRTDIAVATRQGELFVFATRGDATASDWPSFRGTPGNTGVFTEPT